MRPNATKVILLEWRPPRTKQERRVYGLTTYSNHQIARVFINNRYPKEAIRTFWHEMFHAFCNFHQSKGRIPRRKEEQLAKEIERAISKIL